MNFIYVFTLFLFLFFWYSIMKYIEIRIINNIKNRNLKSKKIHLTNIPDWKEKIISNVIHFCIISYIYTVVQDAFLNILFVDLTSSLFYLFKFICSF